MSLQKTFNRLILESGDGDIYENAINLLWSSDKDNIEVVFTSMEWMDLDKLDRYIQNSFGWLVHSEGRDYKVGGTIPMDKKFFEWIGWNHILYLNIHVKRIPKEIAHFKKLEILNCSDSGLMDIDEALYSLSNLTDLTFRHNLLTNISDSIIKLKKLDLLDVGQNMLTDLPVKSLLKLPMLDVLIVDNNNLQKNSRYYKKLFRKLSTTNFSNQRYREAVNLDDYKTI